MAGLIEPLVRIIFVMCSSTRIEENSQDSADTMRSFYISRRKPRRRKITPPKLNSVGSSVDYLFIHADTPHTHILNKTNTINASK
jgi:hypothetical protein